MFMDRDGVDTHKHARKERVQFRAWSIKDLLYGFGESFSCGAQLVIPSGQDSVSFPACEVNQSAGFGSTQLTHLGRPSRP